MKWIINSNANHANAHSLDSILWPQLLAVSANSDVIYSWTKCDSKKRETTSYAMWKILLELLIQENKISFNNVIINIIFQLIMKQCIPNDNWKFFLHHIVFPIQPFNFSKNQQTIFANLKNQILDANDHCSSIPLILANFREISSRS